MCILFAIHTQFTFSLCYWCTRNIAWYINSLLHLLAHLALMPKSLCNHELSVPYRHCPASSLSIVCGHCCWPEIGSEGIHILHKYACMHLVHAHKIFNPFGVHFQNGSHFPFVLNPPQRPIWLVIEPRYLIRIHVYASYCIDIVWYPGTLCVYLPKCQMSSGPGGHMLWNSSGSCALNL